MRKKETWHNPSRSSVASTGRGCDAVASLEYSPPVGSCRPSLCRRPLFFVLSSRSATLAVGGPRVTCAIQLYTAHDVATTPWLVALTVSSTNCVTRPQLAIYVASDGPGRHHMVHGHGSNHAHRGEERGATKAANDNYSAPVARDSGAHLPAPVLPCLSSFWSTQMSIGRAVRASQSQFEFNNSATFMSSWL